MMMNSSIPTPVTFVDTRKKRVMQTNAEVSKVADKVFTEMLKNGEKFPIGLAFRGLGNYYNEAQAVVLPSDRIATFGTPDRKSFISKLNYRFKRICNNRKYHMTTNYQPGRAQLNAAIQTQKSKDSHPMRFHMPHFHLASVFGDDWFSLKAEAFARFFGTPFFLIAQTIIVGVWIFANVIGWVTFDAYPFILLNLAFSLQAAYAAPLILLAQTRQAERDKKHVEADAHHREDIANASEQREILANQQTQKLLELMNQNTELTELTKKMSERIETLTAEMHAKFLAPVPKKKAAPRKKPVNLVG